MKRQPTEMEKIFACYTSDKELMFIIHKQHKEINSENKQTNLIFNMGNGWELTSTIEYLPNTLKALDLTPSTKE